MADYPGTWKVCATCAYWMGRRDADLYGSRAISCENQGRCAIPQGPWRNAQKPANSGCSSFMKWPVLR